MITGPRYKISETASYVGVAPSTVASWARASLLTTVDDDRFPVPFVGLVEAVVFAALRETGISRRRIHPAIAAIAIELGGDTPLAQERFPLEGPSLLDDFASARGDRLLRLLTVRHDGGRAFHDLIAWYLNRIEYVRGRAVRVTLPITERPLLVVDPQRAFGAPLFIHGGARLGDVLSRIRAGEDAIVVASDFGVPLEDVTEALALPSRIAA